MLFLVVSAWLLVVCSGILQRVLVGVFFGFKCWNCVVSGSVLLGASQLVSVELGGAEVALWCVSGGVCIARGGGLGC